MCAGQLKVQRTPSDNKKIPRCHSNHHGTIHDKFNYPVVIFAVPLVAGIV